MDLHLGGTTAIVTGASSGIGLETARLLAHEGAAVLLCARDERRLARAAERVSADAAGGAEAVATVATDVTEPGAGEIVLEAAGERFEGVHALVNNAGTSRAAGLDELTDQDWQEQFALNVLGPMRLMRAIAPVMERAGGGRIVNVCSSSGKRPSLTNVAYSVTKAAQLSLSRAFADTYADRGVLVNAVAPGPVETPLWTAAGGLADQQAEAKGTAREQALEAARAKIPRGRFGSDAEIAVVVAFLCSPLAANVVGAAWSVDGGTVPSIV